MAELEKRFDSYHTPSPKVSSDESISQASLRKNLKKNTCHDCNPASPPPDNKAQPKRYTIDVTAGAAAELRRIQEMCGMTAADVFRNGLNLMRIYVYATAEKKELQIVDPKNPKVVKVIQLPVFHNLL